jgi:predicted nucleotidyltransferase
VAVTVEQAARTPDTELCESLRAVLANHPGMRLGVLFGSAAADRRRPESDVDVAVLVLDVAFSPIAEAALQLALARVAAADVDLIRIETAPTLLRWQIATKGRPVFEASPGEFARFQARAAAEYLEYAPALSHYGEIFRRRISEGARSR